MPTAFLTQHFHVDALSRVMIALVVFIALVIARFSFRYMRGDSHYGRFFRDLALMTGSVSVLVTADNLWVLLGAWCTSNFFLVRLMIHKPSWRAARASGLLTARYFILGAVFVGGAFTLFTFATGQRSIRAILAHGGDDPAILAGMVLLVAGAMTQSAIWPFHRWLTSSLNSPTPVSAMMHAGLVNGGGFLLARFGPLFLDRPIVLHALFILGLVSALVGTLFKLMQNDVKRMLAFSTMGQMGFMVVQCGLGLFPAAIAHLCWHGMFKAYLFLGSAGVVTKKRFDLVKRPGWVGFLLALICGSSGARVFALTSDKPFLANDTTLVLVGVAFLAGTQIALSLLREPRWGSFLIALVVTAILGGLYGASVQWIAILLASQELMAPQPLSAPYLIGLGLLTVAWLAMVFGRQTLEADDPPDLALRAYVTAFNGSQPHPATVTAHRNHYDIV